MTASLAYRPTALTPDGADTIGINESVEDGGSLRVKPAKPTSQRASSRISETAPGSSMASKRS
jgi:hypothetical protein